MECLANRKRGMSVSVTINKQLPIELGVKFKALPYLRFHQLMLQLMLSPARAGFAGLGSVQWHVAWCSEGPRGWFNAGLRPSCNCFHTVHCELGPQSTEPAGPLRSSPTNVFLALYTLHKFLIFTRNNLSVCLHLMNSYASPA